MAQPSSNSGRQASLRLSILPPWHLRGTGTWGRTGLTDRTRPGRASPGSQFQTAQAGTLFLHSQTSLRVGQADGEGQDSSTCPHHAFSLSSFPPPFPHLSLPPYFPPPHHTTHTPAHPHHIFTPHPHPHPSPPPPPHTPLTCLPPATHVSFPPTPTLCPHPLLPGMQTFTLPFLPSLCLAFLHLDMGRHFSFSFYPFVYLHLFPFLLFFFFLCGLVLAHWFVGLWSSETPLPSLPLPTPFLLWVFFRRDPNSLLLYPPLPPPWEVGHILHGGVWLRQGGTYPHTVTPFFPPQHTLPFLPVPTPPSHTCLSLILSLPATTFPFPLDV